MAVSALDELIERVGVMNPTQRAKIAKDLQKGPTRTMLWVPNPGPQTEAYLTEADITLYGGQAGGGKSHLELGIGINDAQTGIIFRRELTQTDGLERDGKSIIGRRASFNGTDHEWTWTNGKTLKLGGMPQADSWIGHAGRERDYMGFDEGGEFLEVQVGSIMGWLRAPPGKRARIVIASNPPRTAEGLWLVEWFAPWLDDHHPLFPTEPAKLLWAVYVGAAGAGRTVWVEGPGEYKIEGENYTAKSRTFIPASLEDNPYRNTPEYRATLQSLPEPLRSQLLYGDWKVGMHDAENLVIPTDWVRQAQNRWEPKRPKDVPMCAIGVDASGGGNDPMVQAKRYDGWYDQLVKTPGEHIPKDKAGAFAAALVVAERRDDAMVTIDMGGGFGSAMYEHLMNNRVECHAYKGAEATSKRTADRKLGFTNVRSAAYWGFREALDPSQPGGSPIALPPDPRLIAGLCAPTYEVTPRGIQVEAKSKRESGKKGVVERLGFSPDEADAVIMAWWAGPKEITDALAWAEAREAKARRGHLGRQPRAVMGGRAPLTGKGK